jgi:hypothetical protein
MLISQGFHQANQGAGVKHVSGRHKQNPVRLGAADSRPSRQKCRLRRMSTDLPRTKEMSPSIYWKYSILSAT